MTNAAVQACRDKIAAQIRAYRDLVGAASKASGMSLVRIDAALAAFEPAFFNNLLVALDARFAARAVTAGPGAEVRLLAASLLADGGVLHARDDVPYDADESVLRIDVGERIALNADDFEALCAAFLAQIAPRP
ncbi:hypothetical protein [Scleromatobacter humisilvae]|uniref:Uncharacterized protein n=1 Tax=Scleromatobacter humisilvae TaxID=2897159 RepID=A0A9X1YF36_9BURK|nr:hypothetical protein [Scleromatobacter humisilvae]MCK9684848.1 hypothetical protein [Scleromatobacter humisilvae]